MVVFYFEIHWMFGFHSEVHQNADSHAEEKAASETREAKLKIVLELMNASLVSLLLRFLCNICDISSWPCYSDSVTVCLGALFMNSLTKEMDL